MKETKKEVQKEKGESESVSQTERRRRWSRSEVEKKQKKKQKIYTVKRNTYLTRTLDPNVRMLKFKTKNYSDLKKDSCGACVITPFVIVVADYIHTY